MKHFLSQISILVTSIIIHNNKHIKNKIKAENKFYDVRIVRININKTNVMDDVY